MPNGTTNRLGRAIGSQLERLVEGDARRPVRGALMLWGALEAGRDFASWALRAFADAERSVPKLALRARLGTRGGRASGERVRVAGYEGDGREGCDESWKCRNAIRH